MAAATKHETPKKPPLRAVPAPGQQPPNQQNVILARLRYADRAKLYEHGFGLAQRLVGASMVVVPFYFIYRCVDRLAAQHDAVDGLTKAIVALHIGDWLPWLVSVFTSAGFLSERRLRQKTIATNQKYTKELEERLDPKRSSSGLNKAGKPINEDNDD